MLDRMLDRTRLQLDPAEGAEEKDPFWTACKTLHRMLGARLNAGQHTSCSGQNAGRGTRCRTLHRTRENTERRGKCGMLDKMQEYAHDPGPRFNGRPHWRRQLRCQSSRRWTLDRTWRLDWTLESLTLDAGRKSAGCY